MLISLVLFLCWWRSEVVFGEELWPFLVERGSGHLCELRRTFRQIREVKQLFLFFLCLLLLDCLQLKIILMPTMAYLGVAYSATLQKTKILSTQQGGWFPISSFAKKLELASNRENPVSRRFTSFFFHVTDSIVSLKKRYTEIQIPKPMNLTFSWNWVFADIVKLTWGSTGWGWARIQRWNSF